MSDQCIGESPRLICRGIQRLSSMIEQIEVGVQENGDMHVLVDRCLISCKISHYVKKSYHRKAGRKTFQSFSAVISGDIPFLNMP